MSLENYFKWDFLSRFGKNKFVNRTYIYLIIVPFLIKTLKKFELDKIIDSIPFSWHMFFYSAVFFTIGTILYHLFAPSIIKENDSYSDFYSQGKTWDHILAYGKQLDIPFDEDNKKYEYLKNVLSFQTLEYFETYLMQVPKKEHRIYRFIYDFNNSFKGTPYPPISSNEYNPDLELKKYVEYQVQFDKNENEKIKMTFWKLFQFASEEAILARIISLICFLFGSILILFVLFNSIKIVVGFEHVVFLK